MSVACHLLFVIPNRRQKKQCFLLLIGVRSVINKSLCMQTMLHHSRKWHTLIAFTQIDRLVKNWKVNLNVISTDCFARPADDDLQLSCVILMFQVAFNNSNAAKITHSYELAVLAWRALLCSFNPSVLSLFVSSCICNVQPFVLQ